MNIFIHAHYYLPKTLAGAEIFLHTIAKYLVWEGNDVIVSIDDDHSYEYEGIRIVPNRTNIESRYVWADAVITHLLNADLAIALGRRFNKPVFHLLHNNYPAAELYTNPENNFIIYNSNALKNELGFSLPSVVVHPVTDIEHFANDNDHYYNEYITLVNCCVAKGGMFLQYLADALPQYRFMGVKGSYNEQIIQNSHHRNIQFMPIQTDMLSVYDRTRILIMPSLYESWGMAASEAMASGIPVVCSDTPGLRENCGDAAIYLEQRVQAYREAFERLSDKNLYDAHVRRGKKRNKINDLHKLLHFMDEKTKKIPASEPATKPAKPEEYEIEKDQEEYYVEESPQEGDVKEKKEIKPSKEKKAILKPGRKTKVSHDQRV